MPSTAPSTHRGPYTPPRLTAAVSAAHPSAPMAERRAAIRDRPAPRPVDTAEQALRPRPLAAAARHPPPDPPPPATAAPPAAVTENKTAGKTKPLRNDPVRERFYLIRINRKRLLTRAGSDLSGNPTGAP